MKKTHFSVVALFLTTLCFAAGKPQILNRGNGAEPKTIDPHKITGVPEHNIVENLFESLVSKDPKTLKPIPGDAEKWEISKDGKVYTFHIRKNSKWSNGDPVTANDYVYSWTRVLDPKTASEYAYYGYYFKNGKDFNLGKLKDASQLGFKAVDAHTLQVTLENPTPYFLSLLYHASLNAVHRPTVEKHGDRWIRPENFVGNGAFTVEKWETNKVFTMKPNPHYYDRAKVKLDQVNYYPLENLNTEENMFRTGKLDVTNEIPLEKIPQWRADKTGVFTSHTVLGTYFFALNVKRPPFDNKKLRKALNLAIDRDRLIKYVTKGNQLPAQSFTVPGTGVDGYVPPKAVPVDGSKIAEAKKLLAEAGYPDGKGLPPIELIYNTHEGHKKIAEAVQQMWKQNLGVNVQLLNQEWKVFLDTRQKHQYQIARHAWLADYNDPYGFLDIFITGAGTNDCAYSNPEYDRLLKASSLEMNPKKRMKLLRQAEDILMDDLPFVPVYFYRRNFLVSKKVQNWPQNAEQALQLKYVSIKE